MDKSATAWRKLALLSSAVFGGVGGVAHAQEASSSPQDLPQGGIVTAGRAHIGPDRGGLLTVEQSTQNAIINWNSFSIGAGRGVHFEQPNVQAATLNRVTGDTPSTLAGSLTATGSVFLVNPNGIGIAPGAIIDTGSFAASTLDIADADFLSGTLRFRDSGGAGTVTNAGLIRVRPGGSVALVGSSVVNHGVIQAELGTVALAAGDAVTLDFGGDGFLSVTASEDDIALAMGVSVDVVRSWSRQGANILMRSDYAERAMLAAVNVPSALQARSVRADASGAIVLEGGAGLVDQSGVISAGGGDVFVGGNALVSVTGAIDASGGAGGSIRIEGGNVLSAGALNASGAQRAGQVSIDASGRFIATTASSITANGPIGGAVSITADDGMFSSGTIEAMGSRGAGGGVALGGADITLVGAHVNASGVTEGGEIRVGFSGDVRNPNISATTVDVAPSTTLRADATGSGDGGLVALWSRESTQAFGAMSARGGARGGDGGFIEASSRGEVFAGGAVDAGAPFGARGTFSLDPRTIIIDDVAGIFPQYQLLNPNASAGDLFGGTVLTLANGNVVVTASQNDFGAANAGAVYLFDNVTGALISSLFGSSSGDALANNGVVALTNGNFVFRSTSWDNGPVSNGGAVTWGSGVSGVSGVVSGANSLIGSSNSDQVGFDGITALANGNYLVRTSTWNNVGAADAGAVTWGSGTTGVAGVVSASNSLVGSTANDLVGQTAIVQLTNGSYVVVTPTWGANNFGAVTWGSGTLGRTGAISAANSLVGSLNNDQVGGGGVTALSNGNYVVRTLTWDLNGTTDDVGAVTWGSGAAGVAGLVSGANSLVGAADNDQVGSGGIVELANGNYVVISPLRDNGANNSAGAVTWASGTAGGIGTVGIANSLVGGRANDQIGSAGVLALSNGNYVVSSPLFDQSPTNNDVGAVTWRAGNGSSANGAADVANSLIGSVDNDAVGSGGVVQVGSGNYAVISSNWDNAGAVNAGAVTWGNGTTGRVGAVSAANSVVGATVNNQVGNGGVVLLSNGNFVIRSTFWDNGAATDTGAVTFVLGNSGLTGAVGAGNSLIGSALGDRIGTSVTALTNGNYVVNSSEWNNAGVTDAGAATWGSGATGIVGTISAANSLVGTTTLNQISGDGTIALANGNYVVRSSGWDNGAASDVGAVTFGNGATGTAGNVSAANSLVGSSNSDRVGQNGVTLLSNGNYVVRSSGWNNGATADVGAATWGSATTGVSGAVSAANSLIGASAGDSVSGDGVFVLANGNYVVRSLAWDNGAATDAGAVTWGSGTGGTVGVVSAANSLVGSRSSDNIGSTGISVLGNGNYVVRSMVWDNGVGAANAGAVTWGSGLTGVAGAVSAANSLVGSTATDNVGQTITLLGNNDYLISSPLWNNGAIGDAGAVSWGDGARGVRGAVSTVNSIVGAVASQQLGSLTTSVVGLGDVFLARSTGAGEGRVYVGLTDPNQLSFARAQDRTITVRTAFLTDTLNTGTDVLLQANSDIVLNSALVTNNPSGAGGALSLVAGRSILLNAGVTTDGGDLTLLANAGTGAGVINAFRDPGAAVITMAAGSSIDAGGGAVRITLGTGAGQTNNSSGDIALRGINAGSVLAENLGAGDFALNGVISASVGATPIILAAQGGDFLNGFGAGALNPGAGRFLVFSQSPTLSAINGLIAAPWYATAYNPADPDGTVLGASRFVYTLAPTLTVTADNTSRPYGDANPVFDYSVSGLVGADTEAGAVQGLPGFVTLATASSNIGGYTITPNLGTLGSAYNYGFSFADGLLTINPRAVTVTADDIFRAYGDGNPALTFSDSGLGAGAALVGALMTSAAANSNVGSYGITQGTLTDGLNPNYAITFIDGVVTIQQRAIDVTATSFGRDYGDANPLLAFTTSDLGAGAAVFGDVTTTATASSNIGDYAITEGTVTNANNPNYAINFINGVLSIDPRSITVTADSFARDYGDANLVLTFATSSLGAGSAVLGEVTTAADATTGVGGYAITQGTVTNGLNPNYDITFVNGVLTINQRAINVTANSFARDYGDANAALTFATSSLGVGGAAVLGDLATAALSTSNVGVYGVTQGTVTNANNPNYLITFTSGAITVDPRAVTVTANNYGRAYGDGNPTLEFTTTDLGFGAALAGAVTTIADATTNVGNYAITQGTVTDSLNPNYEITFVNGVLTIAPRGIIVTADGFVRDYGDANPTFTYTYGDLGAGVALVGSPTTLATAGSNIGGYAITQGDLTAINNPNYAVSFVNGLLTIEPRPINVTADSFTRDYGDGNPGLTYAHSSLGAGAALNGALTTAATDTANVGGYGITEGTLNAANNPNYDITFSGGVLTIQPRAITVTATDAARDYGDANPGLGFSTSSLGAGAAVAGAVTTGAQANSDVGGYAITQGSVANANNPNYTITFVNGVLTIQPRAVTVTANDLTRLYGDANGALTFANTSLGAGEALAGSLSTTAGAGSNVGSYVIGAGALNGANNPNYTITFVDGALTITPRPIVVTADDFSRIYGDANPNLSFTTSDLGGGAAVSGSLSTAASQSSNVGAYAIDAGTITNANNPNYDISFVGGALTITPRPIVVTADDLAKVFGSDDPPLTFDITSGSLFGADAFTGGLARDPGETPEAYAIRQGSLALGSNYTLSFVNGALTIQQVANGDDLAPRWTPANGESAQRGDTSTTLTGPSGVVIPSAGAGPNTQGGDQELCFESADGICVVGP